MREIRRDIHQGSLQVAGGHQYWRQGHGGKVLRSQKNAQNGQQGTKNLD